MYKIEMTESNLLVKKLEEKNVSKFDTGGTTEKNAAIYTVVHAPEGSEYMAGDLVLLRPGDYYSLYFVGELLTTIDASDIIGKVTEAK